MPRKLKNWLETYMTYTSGQESPGIFHYWTGVSILAFTLARSCWVDMSHFKIYPNMFLVLVGPTGVGKSTASNIGIKLFKKAFPEVFITRGKVTIAKMIEDMGAVFTETGTARACIYASEFKVFTQSIQSNSSIIEDLTDLYECPDDWDYRTKNAGVVALENVCINILAASIPEWIGTTSGAQFTETGFSARILYIGSPYSDRCFHKPFLPPGGEQMYHDMISDLQHIATTLTGEYRITKEADKYHETWYRELKNHKRMARVNEKLRGYEFRKDAHMLKTAMLLKAAISDDMTLDVPDLQRAVHALDNIQKGILVAYQSIAYTPLEAAISKIEDMIKISDEGIVSHRTILRAGISMRGLGVKGPEDVIAYMLRSGHIEEVPGRRTDQKLYKLKKKEEKEDGKEEA